MRFGEAFGKALGGFGSAWEGFGKALGRLWELLGKLSDHSNVRPTDCPTDQRSDRPTDRFALRGKKKNVESPQRANHENMLF